MDTKGKIKIVKKGTRVVEAGKATISRSKVAKEASRQMVSNVSSWVNEFQQRKRVETRQAFENLFPTQPQPNNA
jgi:hypothetical protein